MTEVIFFIFIEVQAINHLSRRNQEDRPEKLKEQLSLNLLEKMIEIMIDIQERLKMTDYLTDREKEVHNKLVLIQLRRGTLNSFLFF